MKTTRIRLLATMITLAAVTILASSPVTAQRRSTGRQTTKSGDKSISRSKQSVTPKKNTYKANTKVQSAPRTSSRSSSRSVKRAPSNSSKQSNYISSQRQNSVLKGRGNQTSAKKPKSRSNYGERSSFRSDKNANTNSARQSQKVYASRSTSGVSSRQVKGSAKVNRYNTSMSSSGRRESAAYKSNKESYRLNTKDKRYTPNRNYRGSNKTWSQKHRPSKMNYHHNSPKYYKNYNYYNHRHWDRRWEHYQWSCNSWIDYYHGYHPNSYIYHSNYYHHGYYGHVIRRFNHNPYVFIHNHNRYYCYNGHFFRYRRGIGYILVNMPYGFTFDYLPHGYEQVYINGYLYFRIGNLFFEYRNHQFNLVHYPERYLAFNNSYHNDGYYFEDY